MSNELLLPQYIELLAQHNIDDEREQEHQIGERYWLWGSETPQGEELQLLRAHLVLVAPPVFPGNDTYDQTPRNLKILSLAIRKYADTMRDRVDITVSAQTGNGMHTSEHHYNHKNGRKNEFASASNSSFNIEFYDREVIEENTLPIKIDFPKAVAHILAEVQANNTENIQFSEFELEINKFDIIDQLKGFRTNQ